jgi:hypothetical protein
MDIDELEEFPSMYNMAPDLDAFADETGYEGAYNDQDFFFTTEKYGVYNSYDEDELVVAGRVDNKDIYDHTPPILKIINI